MYRMAKQHILKDIHRLYPPKSSSIMKQGLGSNNLPIKLITERTEFMGVQVGECKIRYKHFLAG